MEDIPKYKMLADLLRNDILGGCYRCGAALKSEHELAREFSLSRQTVRQAVGVLASEALVKRVRGSGTYVTYRGKAGQPTKTVGVVTTYISDYIFPEILNGIEMELAAHGYTMNLSATKNQVENEKRILDGYLKQPVDGLIVEGTKSALPNPNLERYRKLEENGIPVVFINGYDRQLQNAAFVLMDDKAGARQATEYLIGKGFLRIGGIFKSDDMQGTERYAGYLLALQKAGLPLPGDACVWFTTESREAVLKALMVKGMEWMNGCDAVLCYNDEMAAAVLNLLKQTGGGCRTAVMGFDDSAAAALLTPGLTTMRHAKAEMGRRAAQNLLRILAGGEGEKALLAWELCERESTAGR